MKAQNRKMAGWFRCVMTFMLSIVVLATLSGCTKKETTPAIQIPPNYTTFTDDAGLFSISYPPDWEPALSLIPDLETAIKDIITAIKSDAPVNNAHTIFLAGIPVEAGYQPNVNIGVESIPGVVVTHNGMVEAEIKGIKQTVPDYREFSRVKTTVDGREATIIDWEGTYPQIGKNHWL